MEKTYLCMVVCKIYVNPVLWLRWNPGSATSEYDSPCTHKVILQETAHMHMRKDIKEIIHSLSYASYGAS